MHFFVIPGGYGTNDDATRRVRGGAAAPPAAARRRRPAYDDSRLVGWSAGPLALNIASY